MSCWVSFAAGACLSLVVSLFLVPLGVVVADKLTGWLDPGGD